jgi:hypothetical protein
MSVCLRCGTNLEDGEMTCGECGKFSRVAEAPLEEEAVLIHNLLESAGFHPILAWLDNGGHPRALPPATATVPAMGLLPPVTNPFVVFVPEDDADEAAQVLQDAGRGGPTESA